MGSRGPAPKRDAERAGHNAKSDVADQVSLADAVHIPPANPRWATAAQRWYNALKVSGQSRYFEPTDWEQARIVAELLSQQLKKGTTQTQLLTVARALLTALLRFASTQDDELALEIVADSRRVANLIARLSADASAAMMKEVFKAMADLGTTEGARRRMRIEVEREQEPTDEFRLIVGGRG